MASRAGNPYRPRPYRRGYGARHSLSKKKPLTRSIHLDGTAAKMAALQSAQRRATVPVAGATSPKLAARDKSVRRRAGVHARRNNTALNTATSPVPRTRRFHTLKYDLQPVPVIGMHCGQNGRAPICPKAQRVGRARSPLRAGVGRANPASRPESWRPRPYGRGYEPVICWCRKNTLLILHPAGRGLPALPAIGF